MSSNHLSLKASPTTSTTSRSIRQTPATSIYQNLTNKITKAPGGKRLLLKRPLPLCGASLHSAKMRSVMSRLAGSGMLFLKKSI